MGSTVDPPVPSGDPPDGTGRVSKAKLDVNFAVGAAAIPVGGSPSGDSPLGGKDADTPVVAINYRTLFSISSGQWPDDTGW